MALQPAPPALRGLLGDSYKWLTKLIHDLNNTQSQVGTDLYVSGLTFQNNTPSGGKITWSACTVYYQGVAYAISAGSTTGSELFVWWVVGANTFSIGNSYVPGPTIFPILTNNLGTADVTWNKVGSRSIQDSQLTSGLLFGMQMQPDATVNVNATVATATTILSVTNVSAPNGGGLLTVGMSTIGSTNGIGQVSLRVTIDGQTPQTLALVHGASLTPAGSLLTIAASSGVCTIYFGIGFKTSLLVEAVVTVADGGPGAAFNVSCLWATKI